jgi:hypothetical protein
MGQNLDQFRAGKRGWDEFLYGALYLALDKPRLSEEQRKEWVSDLQPLKGRSSQEYEEIAAAIEWAVKVHVEWPKYIRRMKNAVDNVDRILRDYRAEMRAKRNADRAANGEEYSPACQELMKKYPNWTRQEILVEETRRRLGEELIPQVKACADCKGKYWVPSTRPNLKGAKVQCRACRKIQEQLFYKHHKAVKQELFGAAVYA